MLSLIVNLLILATYIIIAIIAYVQLNNLRKEKRIEFGYRLYNDFFNFLNTRENKDLKDWLLGKEVIIEDWDRLGDLFEKFEAVYTYMKKKMVDDELFYDLFSFYIEKAFSAKTPSGKEYIDFARKKEKGKITKTDDIFIGVERMYKKIRAESSTRKEPDF